MAVRAVEISFKCRIMNDADGSQRPLVLEQGVKQAEKAMAQAGDIGWGCSTQCRVPSAVPRSDSEICGT